MPQVPEQECPSCGKKLDAVSNLEDPVPTPGPGDATVCLGCGHIMIFAEDLTLRAPTTEEMHDLAARPDLLQIMQFIEAYQQRYGKHAK
jgi:hypothetical protein